MGFFFYLINTNLIILQDIYILNLLRLGTTASRTKAFPVTDRSDCLRRELPTNTIALQFKQQAEVETTR